MKKFLVAVLALGVLSFAPTVEAKRCPKKECKKACPKKEKTFKSCAQPECTETTVLDHSYYVPTMVPGKRRVDCYKTVRTCTNQSECCEEVPCEDECLEDGETIDELNSKTVKNTNTRNRK
jgi:hypothetical protein